jgi:gamma-D-glutamyl-L-lysine dipeptidyl-peptidase
LAVEPGTGAVVRVAVATLWDRPENVRPVDAPALRPVTDIRGWVAGLDPDEQVGECVLSQLLLGERVLVDEVRADGWVRVVATEQPADKLDPRGYPGWILGDHLAPERETAVDEELVVDATATALRDHPGGDVTVPGVIIGTRLAAAGPTYRGWRPVWVPGHDRPLWALARDVAPRPTGQPAAEEVLSVAARLLDVAYVWGGVSAYGIDCSGLVHLAWRRFGVRLPRDADDQAGATTPLTLGDERPGDLYFFARPDRQIHHIGFVAAPPDRSGARRMLHASYRRRRVVDEPLADDRVATLVGSHRVTAGLAPASAPATS